MKLQGRNLSLRMQGADIAILQSELRQLGYTIADTELRGELFSDTTRQAVVNFQTISALDPSGIVDAATASKINAAVEALQPAPTPLPSQPQEFMVQGHVRQEDGSALAGAIVRPFDKDLRSGETLGEAVTDSTGHYAITYQATAFSKSEKDQADLVVRVFDTLGTVLVSSPILFNAPPEATVDLMVGGGQYRGPSEYEQVETTIRPLLDGVTFADLTEDDTHQDFTFLVGETGLERQRIVFLALSNQLVQRTEVPAAAIYGLVRQGLPTNLAALLAQSPGVWRVALQKSLRDNVVPLAIGLQLDSIIAKLQQLAAQFVHPVPPVRDGFVRLATATLSKTVLENLQPDSADRGSVNESLNGALRAKLAAAFRKQGQPGIADAIAKMPSIDVAASKDLSMQSFAGAQIAAQVQSDAALARALESQIPRLSAHTTIGALLALDRPTRDHPLFQKEVRKADFAALVGTSSFAATSELQDRFISLNTAQNGSKDSFWDKLRQDPAFQAPGAVEDLQFTFQLGALTTNNVALIKALRGQQNLKSLRDLVGWGAVAWTQLIKASANGGPVVIPPNIPGSTPEERTANYAGAMIALLKKGFPTAVLSNRLSSPPTVDLALVKAVLSRNPQFSLGVDLPANLDLSGVSADDQVKARAAVDALNREVRMFPSLDYKSILGAAPAGASPTPIQNPIRRGVLQLLTNSPDFDLQTSHVDAYVAAHTATVFQNVPEHERNAVVVQLKRMQRVFRVTPDSDQIHALMGKGFGSAHGIARVPKSNFLNLMAEELGGEAQATFIYSQALHVNATASMVFVQIHQALNGITPRVIGGGFSK